MIEEAAGTRLYESKRQGALNTIEKKDAKLKEIEAVSEIMILIVELLWLTKIESEVKLSLWILRLTEE